MLSKRDKLIIKVARQLDLFEDGWVPAMRVAKSKEPKRPVDKILRDLGLITQKEQRRIARSFNEHVQMLRSGQGKLAKPSARMARPNVSQPGSGIQATEPKVENTIVLGVGDQVSGSSNLDKTTVLADDQRQDLAGQLHNADNTVVLSDAKNKPAADLDATYVLSENAADAPLPEFEGTIVLGADDQVQPNSNLEPTYVLSDSDSSNSKPRAKSPAPDIDATFVLKDDQDSSSQQAQGTALDLNLVAPDKGRSKQNFARPQQSRAKPAPDIDATYVLRDDAGDEPLAVPGDIESTFVMRDDDLIAPGAPAQDLDVDSTYVLRDEELTQPNLNLVAPTPAKPELNLVAPQSQTSSFVPDEATFVLKDDDDLPALSPLDDDEDLPDLSIPDDFGAAPSPALDLDSTYVLKDEPAQPELNLAIPSDGDLPDLGLGDATFVLPENESAPKKPAINTAGLNLVAPTAQAEAPGLSLKSESSPRGNSARHGKKGGALNRETFRYLAKNRKSFKGYTIGDYKVKGEISRGAMGVILKAEPIGMAKTMASARGFEGDVAVKVMLENNVDPKEAERFIEEMKVLTKLNHSNIVRIFDCGAQGGLSYFSMELLRGVDVRDMVRKDGPPPIMLTLRIISQVASALAFIHKSTIYHRDLKPMNIIFDKSTKPFRAVLIDFGLVTNHGSDGDKGLIVGTPQYMPPEQAAPRGGFGSINATSDIYSLGATLYYMLTGRPPFIGRDPRKIIKRVVSEPVKDPSEINADVPKRIAEICLKCLEKQQRDRYPSANILLAELDKELKSSQRKLKAKSLLSRLWNRKE